MKKRKILFIILISIVLIFGAFFFFSGSPISVARFEEKVNDLLQKRIAGKSDIYGIQLLVSSGTKDIDLEFAVGEKNGKPLEARNPFHTASIGKMFNAALIHILAEQGKLSLDDKISGYFDEGYLDGLFAYQGTDYQDEVSIAHLVSHTSGIGDYYEGSVKDGLTMTEWILSSPEKVWMPEELIAFTREHQEAVGKPGEDFYYSDTGFILLGMIIEKASGKEYHQALHDEIFTPLGMEDSYMLFRSKASKQPQESISGIWFEGVDASCYDSLSMDWSGGGIVSTLTELKLFIKALYAGEIISAESLNAMKDCSRKFHEGIYYGQGMMQVRFKDYSAMLGFLPDMEGHIGDVGTYVFYDPEQDLCVAANYGSSNYPDQSIEDLVEILMLLDRVQP